MKIAHIAVYVKDLESARDFFIRYFGAVSNTGYHNPKTNFKSYFLRFQDNTQLELMQRPDMRDSPKSLYRTGFSHLAFSAGSREAVDALTARLKSDGYPVISGPRITGDSYYESCILGFEENLIEIVV